MEFNPKILFIAERGPGILDSIQKTSKEKHVNMLRATISGVFAEMQAQVFDNPVDVERADGFVVDLSYESPDLWHSVEAAVDTGRSLLAIGSLRYGPESVHGASRIKPDGIASTYPETVIGGLRTFLGLYMGLSLPIESDTALMPLSDPKTRAKLRITAERAKIMRQMEIDDAY